MLTTAQLDFEAVRTALKFESVLSHYGFEMVGRPPQIKILCPFHDDNNPTCSINLERNIFKCFACNAKGNVFDFVVMMEGGEPDKRTGLNTGAHKAVEIMGLDPQDFLRAPSKRKAKPRKAAIPKTKSPAKRGQEEPEQEAEPIENKILDLRLNLDPEHPYLAERNLDGEIISEFGIGYCKTGMMRGRICFPLHNEKGQLVAYAGRYAEETLPEGTPRYKLPKGFYKQLVLYNYHRLATKERRHVVLVEGFWSVLRLHSLGIPVVGCFGHDLSLQQVELLRDLGTTHVNVVFDGDEAGRAGATSAIEKLSRHFYARRIDLPEGIKPDVMSDEYLDRLR